MYQKEECKVLICDNCRESYTDDHTGFSLFVDENSAWEYADRDNWHEENDKHYCPNCYKVVDDDVISINTERTVPAPEGHPEPDYRSLYERERALREAAEGVFAKFEALQKATDLGEEDKEQEYYDALESYRELAAKSK